MPNSYVCNPELHLMGQNMNDRQTGSSNVLLKLLVRHVFGFQPGFDDLRIAPAAWLPFAGFRFRSHAHGRRVEIRYRQEAGPRRFALNGRPWERVELMQAATAAHIPYESMSSMELNIIEITGSGLR